MSLQHCFEALSDPARRKILEVLKGGEMSVAEIAKNFEFTGATLSHHLSKLKNAGLVVTRRDGQTIFYSLQTSVVEEIASHLAELLNLGGKKREKKSTRS